MSSKLIEEVKVSRRGMPILKKEREFMAVDELPDQNHAVHLKVLKHKGVQAEAHPLDRRSGTGRGKEMRKAGVGRHNWGTYQDEFKNGYQSDESEVMVYTKVNKVEVACPMSLKVIYMEQPVEFSLVDFPEL